MALVRPAAVAGTFYSDDREFLQSSLQEFARRASQEGQVAAASYAIPKALIAPHAGHRYSGYCAMRAYLSLPLHRREQIRRIILLGPAHFFAANGMAVTRADWWESPLGPIAIDRDLAELALGFSQVEANDTPHMREHCLEVHVPFFKHLFPQAKLLPFAVTQASPEQVAEVLEALWGGDETLIVISTDLSHYNSYDEATRLDSQTAQWIEHYDWHPIGREHACGREPMAGLLALASSRKMAIERLYMMNSGDALGDRQASVVGYGSWALH